MKANSDKSKQSNKATHRVIAGVLCGASVLSLVLSLVMPPISQAIANDAQEAPTEEPVMGGGSSSESTDVDNTGGDAENQNSDDAKGDETGDGAAEMAPLSDDAETEGAAQPADDSNSDENAIALASVNANKIEGDVTDKFNNGGNYCLTGDAWSSKPINISQNTTIDLACYKLYYSSGNDNTGRTGCTFITISSGATLTVEGAAKDLPVEVPSSEPGQAAKVNWNDSAPQSLTYYVTESTSTPNGLGTSEKTYQHTVTNFGAIVACKEGYVNQVISVEDGGTLNLNGGMITTPRTLGNDGHVILSQGTVNISGGYVTNGNGGGWGGGLCVTGTNAKFNMTGGVIAANMAASGGGVYADNSATLNLSGGVISGNATYKKACDDVDNPNNGYGGGVFTKNADVTINGTANITNNRVDSYITTKYNNGLLGGGGIACTNHGKLTMTGGSVTANYSYEAGGGIYAGFHNQSITFSMTGGTIAGNESANAEGGGLRISSGTTGVIEAASAFSKVYITNNKTMTGKSRGGDWGGGGVFIQKGGRLNVLKSLITDNKAGGWSGGIGACPTGETIVSHSDGAAIYNNTDNVDQDGKHLDTPHYSAGGDGKTEDSDEENYVTPLFQTSGHKDFFLVRNKNGADKTIAVVLGKMLGGGSAGWQGTCDGNPITIDPNGGAGAKYMFGLQANPSPDAKKKAKEEATTIISGNYSYTHGGGIMTNGDLVVGKVDEPLNVYPAIKVKANKVLLKDGEVQGLSGHDYQFKLLGKADGSGGEPYWNTNGTLNANGCEATPEVTVNDEGEIVIDTAANFQSGNYDLYLVEVPIDEKGTTFDKTIYKIHVEVGTSPVETTNFLGVKINRYAVDASTSKVFVKKKDATEFKECEAGFYNWSTDTADSAVSTVKIGDGSNPAFKNELAPYKTSGTWTPQVTKKVDGGEMKKFKFKLFTEDTGNTEKTFQPIYTYTSGSENPQTVEFDPVEIGPLGVDELDNNRQAQFTYYICECPADENEGTEHEGYKNDTKTFKVVVTAKDNGDGTLTCTPTYYEVDANGAETETKTPTFTNTYSTSLPLSGMSGVTLTYLAGAAVLCAAAAWMHIRRKANAKGGERRE